MTNLHLNLAYEPLDSPPELIRRYTTLSVLAEQQAAAGLEVTVLQRYARDESLSVGGVRYEFRHDRWWTPEGRPWMVCPRLTAAARRRAPDVVHLHGLLYAAQVYALRRVLPSRTALIVQDHGIKPWSGRKLKTLRRRFLAAADGLFLNTSDMAAPLRDAGLLPRSLPCFAVGESSSMFQRVPRDLARARIGLSGDPLVLWVGRLQSIKDPQTAVAGFCRAARERSGAALALVYQDASELASLEALVAAAGLTDRVTFVGRVAHDDLPLYYSAADLFLTAGRWEGSNYALIEAMACGLWPVCSDNPSHRGMVGDAGHLFEAGRVEACAHAIAEAMRASPAESERRRQRVRARFDAALSWHAIVQQSIEAYRTVIDNRARRQIR